MQKGGYDDSSNSDDSRSEISDALCGELPAAGEESSDNGSSSDDLQISSLSSCVLTPRTPTASDQVSDSRGPHSA